MTLKVGNSITSGSLIDVPLSVSFWFHIDTGAGVNTGASGIRRATDDTEELISVSSQFIDATSDMVVTATVKDGVISSASASVSLTAVDGWHHGGAIFTSNVLRKAYLDYTNTATNTTSITPAFGVKTYTQSLGSSSQGVADIAVWDVAITDAEMKALSEGHSPLLIQPDNLIHYVPCFGGAQDFIQQHGYWTENGTLEEFPFGQPPLTHRLGG